MVKINDELFAKKVLDSGFMTQEQLNNCRTTQQQLANQGKQVLLIEIAVHFRLLNKEQVTALTNLVETLTFDNSGSFLKPGNKFGRYIVEKPLGEGGMGLVYQVRDERLNRSVALKVMHGVANEKQVKRFLQEARAMASLKHPNIIEIYEVGQEPYNYFTMEVVNGHSLSELLDDNVLSWHKIANIMAKSSKAIHYAHQQGIIHRDIKPSNIMLQDNEPKIMDFGLAKDVEEDTKLSKSGEVLGTVSYMPPEQANGHKVDARSDVYSLGASLYEMMTKRSPFQGGNSINLIFQILYEDPIEPRALNPDIPKDLEAICLKCLQKKPIKRYQTAAQLATDLMNFVKNRPINAKPITWWIRLQKSIARNKLLTTSIVIVILSLLLGIFMQERSRKLAQKSAREAIEARDLAKQKEEEAEIAKALAQQSEKDAIAATKLAQEELYRSNLLLADKFNDDNKLKDVNILLKSIKNIKKDADQLWEYKWQKYRQHYEKAHPISNVEIAEVIDFDVSNTGRMVFTENSLIKSYDAKRGIELLYPKDPKVFWFRCAISPNGRWAVTGNTTNSFLIFDFQKQQKYTYRTHNNEMILDLRFSRDSRFIVMSTETPEEAKNINSVALFDVYQQKFLRSFSLSSEKHPIVDDFLFGDISAHNKYVIAVARNNRVYIWNTFNQQMHFFDPHGDNHINGLRTHPNNDNYIATSKGRHLYLCDIQKTQQKPQEICITPEPISDFNFSPDGSKMVVGYKSGKIELWDINTGKSIGILTGHGLVNKCKFSYDGKNIHSAGDGIKLWDLKFRSNPLKIDITSTAHFCDFHPSKDFVACAPVREVSVLVFDPNSGKIVKKDNRERLIGHRAGVSCGAFRDDGLLVTSGFDGSIALWDVENIKRIKMIALPLKIETFCFISKDQRYIIAAGIESTFFFVDLTTGVYKKHNLSDLRQKKVNFTILDVSWDGRNTVAFSGDSKRLYIVDIKIHNDAKMKIDANLRTCPNIKVPNIDVSWLYYDKESAKNRVIVADNHKLTLFEIDGKKANKLTEFIGHTGQIYQIDVALDKKRILSAGHRAVCIWPLSEKAQVRPYFNLGTHGTFSTCAFSRDGNKIIACGGDTHTNDDKNKSFIRIWDASPPK